MARVNSPYYLKGRIDCLQFYEMGGKRYVRMASSLTGKKVKQSPAFARTRESYGRLAKASPIASAVYRQLPVAMRVNGYYEKMVGVVILLLKEGYTPEQAQGILLQAAMANTYLDAACAAKAIKLNSATGIAACVYKQLPECMHVAGYLEALTDMALQLLEEGMSSREAYEILLKAAMPEGVVRSELYVVPGEREETSRRVSVANSRMIFVEKLLAQVFAISLTKSTGDTAIKSGNRRSMYADMPP